MSLVFLIINGGSGCHIHTEVATCIDNVLTYVNQTTNSTVVNNMAITQGSISTFATIFRLIRILRLLRVLRAVRVELRVVSRLAPLFSRFFGVLFFFFYIFAVIGMELFAGTMHYMVPAVAKSSYGLAQYYMNRFDNVYLSFMTLFELMVVNNWNIIMEGYVAATGTEWTRLYFILWFIVIVVVVMNACAGFIIDAYTMLKPKMIDQVHALDDILDEAQRVLKTEQVEFSGGKGLVKSKSAQLLDEFRQTTMQRFMSKTDQFLCGTQSKNISSLNFPELMARLDASYLLNNRSNISTREKRHIIFDQKLQQQLKIMVHIREHSFEHLRRVFGEDDTDGVQFDDYEIYTNCDANAKSNNDCWLSKTEVN